MNLAKLFETQKALDDRIIKARELEGKDLYPNTILALQVELAEFANEGRWFKHWSKDQEPRGYKKCTVCEGKGMHLSISEGYGECKSCKGTGEGEDNPLLEEYVDCVHFFLSIAIQKGWQDALYIYEEQLDMKEFDGGLTGIFLEMTYFLNKSYFEHPSKEKDENFKRHYGFPQKKYWFRTAWILFLNIGINGFGFTLKQIEQAYYTKNQINHERQNNGY